MASVADAVDALRRVIFDRKDLRFGSDEDLDFGVESLERAIAMFKLADPILMSCIRFDSVLSWAGLGWVVVS
eukprot:CAMPEP_0198107990 /NCGR_PEP_ID=MMETSP1442-20131203/71_1 /TAXON_ID= /ORGANISM="Craspedostauros australis, Strain CCMP3328" /LENGTH=71 /DNA_ID=CAMNT_0043763169 /DNA_START=661 /DNA_END=876 /DNA_ORIENTATION=-